MNKGLFAILAAAALAASKNTKGIGSFGLKKNKPLEKFDAWLNLNRMKFTEEFKSEDLLGADWDDDSVQELTLLESLEKDSQIKEGLERHYITGEEQNRLLVERQDILNCVRCPDAWFYSSLYMALVLEKSAYDLKYFKDNSDNPFWASSSLNRNVEKDERYDGLNFFKDFFEFSLAQIQKMKELSGVNEPSASENILLQMKDFFKDLILGGYNYSLKRSVLSKGLYGYCVIQYIRFQLSVSTDKNLAQITKAAFLQQIKSGQFGKYRYAFKVWDGFSDIWGGGFTLFSFASGDKERRRNQENVPALRKLSMIEISKYSSEMLSRIKNKLTDMEYRQIRELFSYSVGRDSSRLSLIEKANSFMKVFYDQNEDGQNIIMNLTQFLASSMAMLSMGENVELTGSPETYHNLSSTLDWWQEEHGNSLDFYPHDSFFHSYDAKVYALNNMLNESDDMYVFTISSIDLFIDVLSEFNTYYSEVNYESLDDAIERYLTEQENGYRSELDELLEGDVPLGFSDDKTITLSPSDRVISQINTSYFDNLEDSNVDVKRVLLVEYRNRHLKRDNSKYCRTTLCWKTRNVVYGKHKKWLSKTFWCSCSN